MSARITLRRLRRLILVDTLRRIHNVCFLVERLIYTYLVQTLKVNNNLYRIVAFNQNSLRRNYKEILLAAFVFFIVGMHVLKYRTNRIVHFHKHINCD